MSSTISFKKKPAAPAAGNPATPANNAAATTVDVQATPVAQQAAAAAPAPAAVATPVANPQTAVPPPTAANTTALAAPTTTALAENDAAQTAGVGGFEGEYSAKDMATPFLSIMQKTSKNFDEHTDALGHWMYDKDTSLGEEVKVVFIRSSKFYLEDLPFGSTEIPQRFVRLQDARAAGFHEGQLQECDDLDLLIEVDADQEGVADLAHIILGDKGYILARYTVRSTARRRVTGILAKDYQGFLKGNLVNGFYTMVTEKRQNDKGSWYVPTLKVAGATPIALRNEIIAKMGAK